VATDPDDGDTYVSPNGHTYTVENPTNNPFYSIKFEEVAEGVRDGDADIFNYAIPTAAYDADDPIQVQAKAAGYIGTVTLIPDTTASDNGFVFSFLGATDNEDGTTTISIQVENDNDRALSYVAISLPQSDGDEIVYHFRVENCGDVVLHGGAHVYDPLINPCGNHEIWSAVVWPGEVYEFDRTYTPTEDDCGELVNTATAIGHPKHPDGYYLTDVSDVDSWMVEVVCPHMNTASIGDYVWHDLFHSQEHQVDGIQDEGEPGIAGVLVELYSGDSLVASTTTDDSGYYCFSELSPATYTVKIADSNFEEGGVLEGWYASPVDRGCNDSLDSDGDESTHTVTVSLSAGEENNDFGFFHAGIDLTKTGPETFLLDDVVATDPGDGESYVSPNGHTYTVENPTNNPFYSIKFEEQDEGIKKGATDIFEYTIPTTSYDPNDPITVKAKAGRKAKTGTLIPDGEVTAGKFTFTFLGATDNGDGTTTISIQVKNDYKKGLSYVACSLPEGDDEIVYHFRVENTGDVVLHGGAHVYDPLINPCGNHEIWSAVVWPGEVYEFDRTYALSGDESGVLINTATAVGHPKHPDGYYLTDVTDVDTWTVQLYSGDGGCGGDDCAPCCDGAPERMVWGGVKELTQFDLTQLADNEEPSSPPSESSAPNASLPMSDRIAQLIYGDVETSP